ncbi:uncharacterized protein LOC130197450 [Pseudoliparis swirei]|uniref:uncharacterized protein LOC130197450 n=1 Tax=Pseudoliparis swirei TaxID=2059687 RepID=UPI0024BD8424|nr:uncharacterized protein LOC130197450 [Pseudoliparis swirei]
MTGAGLCCASLEEPRTLMKMGLCVLLVGHVNFLLGALMHGVVLRHGGPHRPAAVEHAVANVVALASGLVGIVVGVLAIVLSKKKKSRVLTWSLFTFGLTAALMAAAAAVGLCVSVVSAVVHGGQSLLTHCRSADGSFTGDCSFDPTRIYSTTLILWVPLIVTCLIQLVFSARCSAVCASFLDLPGCPKGARHHSRRIGVRRSMEEAPPTSLTEPPGNNSEPPTRYSEPPIRYSESPTHYSESLTRYSESPTHYSESLTRYSESPTRYSESPTRYSESPTHYSESPTHYSDSLTRYSESPTPPTRYAEPPTPPTRYAEPPTPPTRYAEPPTPPTRYAEPPTPPTRYAEPPTPPTRYAEPPTPPTRYAEPRMQSSAPPGQQQQGGRPLLLPPQRRPPLQYRSLPPSERWPLGQPAAERSDAEGLETPVGGQQRTPERHRLLQRATLERSSFWI